MISVIIPCYNVAPFLAECLTSVISQDYHDIEIILVNDGSTDSTAEIIESYRSRDNRVRVVTQSNKGLSEARNAGIDIARGDRLFFLDGDDKMLPGALSTLLSTVKETGADISCGELISTEITVFEPKRKIRVLGPEKAISNILYQKPGFYNSVCGKLFNKSLFDGLRFTPGILYEDLDLFYRIFERAGRIAFINVPVVYYRPNGQSILHTFTPRRLDVLKVTEKIERWSADKSSRLRRSAAERRLSANFNMLGLLSLYDEEGTFSDIAEDCMKTIRKYRLASVCDPRVRLKNKVGSLISYAGRKVLVRLLRRHYITR